MREFCTSGSVRGEREKSLSPTSTRARESLGKEKAV
jgi:hypothetical protein